MHTAYISIPYSNTITNQWEHTTLVHTRTLINAHNVHIATSSRITFTPMEQRNFQWQRYGMRHNRSKFYATAVHSIGKSLKISTQHTMRGKEELEKTDRQMDSDRWRHLVNMLYKNTNTLQEEKHEFWHIYFRFKCK